VYFNVLTHFERMAFVPDDPYLVPSNPPGFPGQWHLKNQFNQGPVTWVESAWARNLTGAGVLIGIVDDGVERAHPDLAPNYDFAHSYDFILDRPGAPVFSR
jgi:subtilisin family serine protease